MNSLLIPEIWAFSASQGGTKEGLKGARAAKKFPPHHPGITALPTGKNWGVQSQQKHGEMDDLKITAGLFRGILGAKMANSFPGAGSGRSTKPTKHIPKVGL